MKEEFGVDLFELTGDQSGGQEGKSEARERTLGMVQYQTLAWYNTKPWYGTIPNLISPYLLFYTTPYRASPCTLSKVKSVAQQSDEETWLAWPSIITSL